MLHLIKVRLFTTAAPTAEGVLLAAHVKTLADGAVAVAAAIHIPAAAATGRLADDDLLGSQQRSAAHPAGSG